MSGAWLLRPLCWIMGHPAFARVSLFWSAGGGLPKAETPGWVCVICDKFYPPPATPRTP